MNFRISIKENLPVESLVSYCISRAPVYLIIIFITVISSISLHAQKQATHWVFGTLDGVDFSCSTPQFSYSSFVGLEGGASISNEHGELLFYTDGHVIWNKNHLIMSNGVDIGGLCGDYASSTQSAIIIPHPGNTNLYYVFTTGCAEYNFYQGLRYSIVDISLEGGLGKVIQKSIYLLSSVAEKVAAVFHQNGKDVWVMTHGAFNNEFYAYLITENGLDETPVTSATGASNPGGRGYMKFSPDGKRLALTSFANGIFFEFDGINPEIHDFDDASGKVTFRYSLPTSVDIYALSFSPNGNLLYMDSGWAEGGNASQIMQYDLEAGTLQDIINSKFVFSIPGIDQFYPDALQLAIDGKLYFKYYINNFSFGLGAIQNPNLVGSAANFDVKYLPAPCNIAVSQGAYGLPNFIESYFKSPVVPSSICAPTDINLSTDADFTFEPDVACGTTFNFKATGTFKKTERSPKVFSYNLTQWEVDDKIVFTSNTTNFQYTFFESGRHKVKLTFISPWDNCISNTIEKEVLLSGIHADFNYKESCDNKVEFKTTIVTDLEDLNLIWDFGDGTIDSVYNTNPTHTYANPGSYAVKLIAKKNCYRNEPQKKIIINDQLNFSFGKDTTFCANSTLTLNAPDKLNAEYLWSNGSKAKSIDIIHEGEYQLTIKRGDCSASDSINVSYRDCNSCNLFPKSLLGKDTINCVGDSMLLAAPDLNHAEFLWNTGSTEKIIDATTQGKYWLKITIGNCSDADTIFVTDAQCENCYIKIPNVFTPNDGDNLNKFFVIQSECPNFSYQFKIYDRWGKLIHKTDGDDGHDNKIEIENAPAGTYFNVWNGRTKDTDAPADVYFYMINYTYLKANNIYASKSKKGTLILIK